MPEADVDGMAVEVEPSHQYSFIFCCCVTNRSRRAVRRNGVWLKVCMEQNYVSEFLHVKRNGVHWRSLVLAEHLWRWNSGCEHSVVVSGVFQQRWQRCERQATFWTAMHSCHSTKWTVSWSAHPHQLADYDQGTVCGAEYQLRYRKWWWQCWNVAVCARQVP